MKLTNDPTNTRPVHFGPLMLSPGESKSISDADFAHYAGLVDADKERAEMVLARLKRSGVTCEADAPAPTKKKEQKEPAAPPAP